MPPPPYLGGICGFSSILTLATVTLPAMSLASSSSAGAIILQGPHHSAQKSTSTGSFDFSTSVSKLASVTAVVIGPDLDKSEALNVGSRLRQRQGSAALPSPIS